jgi:hypothetical protein
LYRCLLEELAQSIQLPTDIGLLVIRDDAAPIPRKGTLLQLTRGSEPVTRPFLDRLVMGSQVIKEARFEEWFEFDHRRCSIIGYGVFDP